MDKKIKVIFIASYSFSGSTMLDMVLGANDTAVSGGELFAFRPMLLADGSKKYCSCGEYATNCEFWTSVKDRIGESMNSDCWQLPKLKVDKMLKPYVYTDAVKMDEYFNNCYAMIDAMMRESGSSVFIDSSKNIPRLLMLLYSGNYDLRIVLLKRGAGGIYNSLRKRKVSFLKPMFERVLYYFLLNGLIKKHRLDSRVVRVSYEALVENPEHEIRKVCNSIEIPYQSNMLKMQPSKLHILHGNKQAMDGRNSGIRTLS